MNIREGMKVMVIHHMSNKGRVTKVYYVPVKHSSGSGTFSKQMRVKFISEIDGQEKDFRAVDLMKIDDEG
tara:strand:- start:133 stop:342 length:210 start_codon:yes stop_codon:yes gene_type:complete